MRYSRAVLVLTFVYAGSLSAQASIGAPPPRARSTTTDDPIRSLPPIQLEDQWTTAVVKRDTRTFDRLLAPEFVYTENSSVMSRGDVIKSVTGPDRVEWARNEGMKVHEFGDVQVVTGVLHLKGKTKKGKAFDRRYEFTDTWQHRSGRWRIIAAQDYLIPR
ncbi:MAG TPA: nuclear transport factor 2 family protein [Gemmatimonadaceae bacterium]|nr:nuclear transport factor 2 family protein [Gemmatimonadaceae bacterium]